MAVGVIIALLAYLAVLTWPGGQVMAGIINRKSLSAALLAVYYYLLGLYTIVFRPVYARPRYCLELFWSYKKAMNGSDYLFYEIVLNYILFLPVGVFVPVFGKKHPFRLAVLAGFLTSVLIECSQLLLRRGLFEFDDILDNVLGTIIGYGIYLTAYKSFTYFRSAS